LLGKNIDINVKRQAVIRVIPVLNKPLTSNWNALFFFNASIIPFELLELLKIDIAARTKPNSIPDIVETTPATDTMTPCSMVIM